MQVDGQLCAKHFAEAMSTARKSVSKADLARYSEFRKDFSGGRRDSETTMNSNPPAPTADSQDDLDEDELYG